MKQQQKVSDSLSARVRGNQAHGDHSHDQPSLAAAQSVLKVAKEL
jgi:hypothetical protein